MSCEKFVQSGTNKKGTNNFPLFLCYKTKAIKALIFALIVVGIVDTDDDKNPFGVPVSVSASVVVAQVRQVVELSRPKLI